MLSSLFAILAEAICMPIRPEFRFPTDLFLLFPHDHLTNIYVPLSFFLLCKTIRPKIRILIDLFLLFVHDHWTNVRGHFYSLIYYFLSFADILFAIFRTVLPLYSVCSISGSSVFIFSLLYS